MYFEIKTNTHYYYKCLLKIMKIHCNPFFNIKSLNIRNQTKKNTNLPKNLFDNFIFIQFFTRKSFFLQVGKIFKLLFNWGRIFILVFNFGKISFSAIIFHWGKIFLFNTSTGGIFFCCFSHTRENFFAEIHISIGEKFLITFFHWEEFF